MTRQTVDSRTLLASPEHSKLVATDNRLGNEAELAEARRELTRMQDALASVYASRSWRLGNAAVRSALFAKVLPRKARSAIRLLILKVKK